MESQAQTVETIRARRSAEVMVARTVDAVLRCPEDVREVADLASEAGYTRSHWTRTFTALVGEPPAAFVRRIRLEKAAHLLRHTVVPVGAVAASCGYADPAAFSRAVRRRFGATPEQVRQGAGGEMLKGTGIHWLPQWSGNGSAEDAKRFPLVLRRRAAVRVACREHFGSYSQAGDRLAALVNELTAQGLAQDRRYFTIYWDNVFTHPTSEGMRSHVGFGLDDGEAPLPGFELYVLPAGRYATLERAVRRQERNAAWAWMASRFQDGLAFDEHDEAPVPWEASMTTLWKRLD